MQKRKYLFIICIILVTLFFTAANTPITSMEQVNITDNLISVPVINEQYDFIPTSITIDVDISELDYIVKTVYGEARGCSKLQQSAVVWCILNRVDDGWGTIKEVATAPSQFHGYSEDNPTPDEIRSLVMDVVMRWNMERYCNWNVGRTLPPEYIYFAASTTEHINVFRDKWSGDYKVWDFNCWNPYEE